MNNEIKEMRKYLLEKNIEDVALMADEEVKEKYKELNKKGVENYKIFEPKHGEECWCVNAVGDIGTIVWHRHAFKNTLKRIGNMFETKEEAEQVAENLKVHQELKELSNEISTEKIDWENEVQAKFFLTYDYLSRDIDWDYDYSTKFGNIVQFVGIDRFKLIEIAIERIGRERLINYLKGC